MRISEAAAACGLSVDTIRYDEKAGMLPEIHRGADGRRVFSEAVDRVLDAYLGSPAHRRLMARYGFSEAEIDLLLA